MASQPNSTVCGLPNWVAFPVNDSTSYINDALAVAVNIPMSIFAFLSNLTIVIIVTRTPQLHKPSNILLCSLAGADCLPERRDVTTAVFHLAFDTSSCATVM